MFKTVVILFSFLCAGNTLFAQATLAELTGKIAAEIQELSDDKSTTTQTLQPDKQKPYRLSFTRSVTDAKGKTDEEKWLFNLADIDKNTVRWESSKKAITVNLRVNRGQKFIQVFKNGEPDGYTDDLILLAKGIDNARALETLFEEAIPLAAEAWEKDADLEGKTADALMSQLLKMVGEVKIGATTLQQQLKPAGDYADRLQLTLEEYKGKGLDKKERFTFSLGDLQEKDIRLRIQGEKAFVEAGTKRNIRWVAVEEEGKSSGYQPEVRFYVADTDQGQILSAILLNLVSFGEAEQKKRLPDVQDAKAALQMLAKTQQKFSRGKSTVEPALQSECRSRMSQRESNDKASELMEYGFHFGDLNEKSIALDIDGKGVQVKVGTLGRDPFVQVWKDGEQKNYDNELAFLFPDVEQARLFEHVLSVAIDKCQQTIEPKDLNWLNTAAAAAEKTASGLSQKLELQDKDPCKWKFTQVESGDKKSKETVYEFNVYDLDSRHVDIKVSGTKLFLEMKTERNQKIISANENGKPSYTAGLLLQLADIETAKTARATMLHLIESCDK